MKYIFRGIVVFEYIVDQKQVIQHKAHDRISAFDYCRMIEEDYKLLSDFFDTVHKHMKDPKTELNDIEVN